MGLGGGPEPPASDLVQISVDNQEDSLKKAQEIPQQVHHHHFGRFAHDFGPVQPSMMSKKVESTGLASGGPVSYYTVPW